MRTVKLAIFLEQQIQAGGGYQQALNATLLVRKLPETICTQIVITTVFSNVAMLREYGIEAIYLPIPKWRRLCQKLRSFFSLSYTIRYLRFVFGSNYIESFLERHNVDIVYFTSPSPLAMDLERLNYIFTVWDLCHRDDPEFPEVRNDRMFELRETLYNKTLTKAVAVLVDSEIGKQNVMRRYGVDEMRAHILPFTPASCTKITESEYESYYINIKQKYDLDTEYVFYPAQFWAHKNHIYILLALKALEDKFGLRIGAIFAGSDAGGNLEYLKNMSDKLKLSSRIKFIGFVDNQEIPYLYRQSLALVMPTYFGPTNLPPLEAFSLAVPVLYPDKNGLREQVGDAALLLDLNDPTSLADHLEKLISDENLHDKLIQNGRKQLESLDLNADLKILEMVIYNFSIRRRCWN